MKVMATTPVSYNQHSQRISTVNKRQAFGNFLHDGELISLPSEEDQYVKEFEDHLRNKDNFKVNSISNKEVIFKSKNESTRAFTSVCLSNIGSEHEPNIEVTIAIRRPIKEALATGKSNIESVTIIPPKLGQNAKTLYAKVLERFCTAFESNPAILDNKFWSSFVKQLTF